MAACEGHRKWELKKDGLYHLVIECSLENCDVGPRFQNRVHLLGNKLIINPVIFGDEDWYIYYCNSKDVWRVHLSLQCEYGIVIKNVLAILLQRSESVNQ